MSLRAAAVFGLAGTLAFLGLSARAEEKGTPLPGVHHVAVYDVDGRFGGWPANHGVWSWGNEILVGFSAGGIENAIARARAKRGGG